MGCTGPHQGVAGSQRWADGAGMLRVLSGSLLLPSQTGKAHTPAPCTSLPCLGLTWLPSPFLLMLFIEAHGR